MYIEKFGYTLLILINTKKFHCRIEKFPSKDDLDSHVKSQIEIAQKSLPFGQSHDNRKKKEQKDPAKNRWNECSTKERKRRRTRT